MNSKPSKIFWFLPSIAEFIFILILIIVLSERGNLLGDADTGYHIRAGEYIIDNLKVPHYDLFSHISPPLEWTAHEWLSEVIMAVIHRATGLTGVVIAYSLLIVIVYSLLFRSLRASGISILTASFVVIFTAGASTVHWLARPHILSLMLTLSWYLILNAYQYRKKNFLYILPPLMLLWVNLHGGFIAGLMLIIVYILGNALTAVWRKEDRPRSIQRVKILFIWFFACVLAALLNPKGYQILFFPFNLISNTLIMNHVNEFLSPNFHEHLIYEYLLIFMILIFSISVRRLNAIEIILVLLFTHMSLYSGRYIPLYALILSPILARQIDYLLHELRDRRLVQRFLATSERTAKTDSMAKYNLWGIATVIVLAVMVSTGSLSYEFDRKKLPVDAVQFMQKEKIQGNMFNNDEFGDYIIYAAWPEYRVFFDGRSDMYGEKRMKEYFKVIGIEPGWQVILEKYNMTWAIYNTKSPLSSYLLERSDWKLIYSDKVANIFVKNTPENQQLIEKYRYVKPVVVEDEEEKKE